MPIIEYNKFVSKGEIMRIGQSTDIHQLVENRPLILGGVNIPYHLGLIGHSDADVLVHAITEAIIGALGLGDLGRHFPDTQEKWRGVSSLELLKHVQILMSQNGYQINNVDALIIIEKPRLAPYIPTMIENIANILNCPIKDINIKATCGEGLGFVGNQTGAIAQAVVLLKGIENE